jgi:hypothetical protein
VRCQHVQLPRVVLWHLLAKRGSSGNVPKRGYPAVAAVSRLSVQCRRMWQHVHCQLCVHDRFDGSPNDAACDSVRELPDSCGYGSVLCRVCSMHGEPDVRLCLVVCSVLPGQSAHLHGLYQCNACARVERACNVFVCKWMWYKHNVYGESMSMRRA